MSLSPTSWNGLTAWLLENQTLRVVIVPDVGARIVSIFDRQAGREWLLGPDTPPKGPPTYAQSYPDYGMCGWDEMFPTIIPCGYPALGVYQGAALPDHGEVWALPWTREATSGDELCLSVEGRALPYHLTRSATLDEPGTLRLRYQVTNRGSEPLVYLWAAHPLMAVDTDTEISLPPEVHEVYNVMDRHPWGKHGDRYAWPNAISADGKQWQLNRVGPAALKDCRKFYVPPELPVSWAGLQQRGNGPWLRLVWSKAELPYLGIWIDEGTYCKAPTVALEPTNAFYDALDTAWQNRRYATLPIDGRHEWSVTVRVGIGPIS